MENNYNKINIQNILKKKNYDLDKMIDFIEFQKILNELYNDDFDINISEQIFEEMKSNSENDTSNLKIFSEVYIDAIKNLKDKIKELNDEMLGYFKINVDLNKKLKSNINLMDSFVKNIQKDDNLKIILNIIEISNLDDDDFLLEILAEEKLVQNLSIINLKENIIM